jgi:DNA-binding transcriptional LysR family regulator
MDPRRVLTFRQVAHERSFSRAARALALTQPAVSHQVAMLEREVGGRLFERGPGGPGLTPAGEALLAHADVIAERFALAETQLGELLGAQDTRLRIGAVPSALAGLVPAALERVRRRHPGAMASIAEGTADDLPGRVRSGELHLAVGFQDAGRARDEQEGLERHDLIRERFLVALPSRHELAARPSVRLADLADDDWIAGSADGIIVRACRAAGFEPRLVSITRDQFAIRALITRGIAVTLAAELLADAFEHAALRPIDGPAPERDVYALLPPGHHHPHADATLKALGDVARELRAACECPTKSPPRR